MTKRSQPAVLKADPHIPFGEAERRLFADAGVELITRPCETEDDLVAQAGGIDALMVVAEPVTAVVVEALADCRVIARFGSGLDNVDVEAATRHGIQVTYVPAASTEEVSDHALAMILALARRLPALSAQVQRGEWGIPHDLPSFRRLRGQTLGIVGLGRIGAALAAKVSGLGLRVVAYDPFAGADAGVELVPLDELLRRSDHVSVHAPLTAGTRHLIGAEEIALMKPSATLVNVARGGIVDERALFAALLEGRLAGAGLDVFEEEPPKLAPQVAALPNLILSPHAAHHSVDSLAELRRTAIEDVLAVLDGRPPRYPADGSDRL